MNIDIRDMLFGIASAPVEMERMRNKRRKINKAKAIYHRDDMDAVAERSSENER